MIRVFLTEYKKSIKINRLLVVMVLALAAGTILCLLPTFHEHPYSIDVYKYYTKLLEGELTDDKTKYLNDRLSEIEELIGKYDEMQRKYTSGEIDLIRYSEYTELHGKAIAEESTVRFLCEKCEALNACSDFDKQIFYDTEWSDLFKDNGYDHIMLLALLCIAVSAFSTEYSSGSYALLLTSKRGKTQLAIAKLVAVLATVFLLSLMLSVIRLGVFAYGSGSEFSQMPVGNILLSDGFGSTTLSGYYLRDALLKGFIWAMYAMLVCLIALLCRNVTYGFVIGFVAGVTPRLVSSVITSQKAVYLLSGLLTDKMYTAEPSIYILTAAVLIKTILLAVSVIYVWDKKQ